jgi:NTE family protein
VKHDLRRIPFFSELEDDVLAAISQRLQREHYHKGATVFSEGESGDCMYLIETGQIKIVAERNGRERPLALLGPGNFFGETALLLSEKRNASARVLIDVDVLVLHKEDLDELLQQHPAIALVITRELSRRLGLATAPTIPREEFSVIATVGPAAPRLARFLAQLTGEEVALVDLGGLANVTLNQASLAQAQVVLARHREPIDAENLPARLSTLVEQFYWVILSVAPYETPLTVKAMELADVTITLGGTSRNWIKDISPKVHWAADESDRSLQRLTRKITGRQVGLALSSGNARGIAHIGLFKVLEQGGIPLDMIAGTSAGAVFGSLYAAGRSIAEMKAFAVEIQHLYNFRTGFRYWDFRIPPRSGVIQGNMILKHFRKWLRYKTFDELPIPLYIVAADLISGEEIVFDRGPVADAVRASMSVIGIIEPAHIGDRFLIDGGSVNPIPSQLLAEKGMDIIVACSVIPSLEDRLHRREQKRLGRPPNLLGIITGTQEIMESEIIKSRMGPVDVLIEPDIARYGTMEYDKVNEIIQRGEEAASRELAHIQQLLAPHPRPPLHN